MAGKQVTELDALPSFTDNSLLPVHNGTGLKKGLLSQLANYLGTKFSNPNLLINPDFKINQRGESSYNVGNSSKYAIDRWKIYNINLNVSTLVVSNSNSSNGDFVQYLENKLTGTFTVTLNVASVIGTVKFIWKDGVTYKEGATISKGVNTYTFTVSELTYVGIYIASGASAQLRYMKLEQGAIATPFVAPNPAEELEKCLRFSRYIPSIYCVPLRRYIGDISNARAYYLPLGCVFETKLRVKGTITLKGGAFDSTGSNIGGVAEIDYSTDEIRTVKMSQEMTPWTIILKQVFIDAEIY